MNTIDSRFMFTTNKQQDFNHKPLNHNRQQMVSSDLIPTNNHNNLNNIINQSDMIHNNNNKLINNLTQEIREKDKEIQTYKNKMELSDQKYMELSREKDQFKSNENELLSLKTKLNEQYDLNKDLDSLNKLLRKKYKDHDIKLNSYKHIICKLKLNISQLQDKINTSFQNETLKNILLKHDFTDTNIHDLFIDYKITENTNITKELLESFIKNP
jgi:chromosome segregation ATPase